MVIPITFANLAGWIFGTLFLLNGFINVFRGNDPVMGIGFMVISLVFFPPVNKIIRRKFGITIHGWLKVVLALILIWISLAVGAIAEGYVF